jgi:hypothetical protein
MVDVLIFGKMIEEHAERVKKCERLQMVKVT